jgi:hypothetical protein
MLWDFKYLSINRRIKTNTHSDVGVQLIGACLCRCFEARLLTTDSLGEREVVEGRLTDGSSGHAVWWSSLGSKEKRRQLVELVRVSACVMGSETRGEVEL